jgi:trk/ktr system potassium uptake protein
VLGSRIRFVLFVDGLLLIVLSAAMSLPIAVDFAVGSQDWRAFAISAGATLYVGGMLILSCRDQKARADRQTGYLLTTSAWLVIGVFASLPLFLSTLGLSYTDAFFETMSGLTTTGSTVIVGLDLLPPGLLLWRSLLQWFGGIGIVVMAILLLPVLRTGGMQLFRTESSDISGKPMPHLKQMVGLTIATYFGLSVACAIAYGIAGMNTFDAINHAMATLATGGYSTKDASIGFYDSVAIELVSIVFMVAGALPLILYARLFIERGNRTRSEGHQVPVLLAILLVAVLLATTWNIYANSMPLGAALRVSAFNVTSVLTDTGFATADFSAWGSFAVGLFFSLYLIGGCAGSTAGAIKIFRWQMLFAGLLRQLKLTFSPHRVLLARYGSQLIDDETMHAVRNFFFMYMTTLVALSLLVMATGVDFLSSTSAVAQAMANAGPGLGPMGGPAGNFSIMPDAAKWLLVAAMLLGRLELATIYVLLLVDYWRS